MKIERTAPEYASVASFVQYCMDDEKVSFLPGEAQAIAERSKRSLASVTAELISYGLKQVFNPKAREVRGAMSNPNGTHPFALNPTFTTPGTDSIVGFAGREGN